MAASARFKLSGKSKPAYQSSQGFSLLEILVAFVMMSLVVGTLLQLFGSSMRNVALSEEYSFAIQIAESRLQSVGTEIKVEQGTERGSEEGTPYSWVVEMEPVELNEDQDDFSLSVQPYRVSVIVAWGSDGKKRQFALSSLRFGEAE
ncbi:MAG: General secretion pathway protein I [uncultured Thiotrichaceae bacterium]|uniref:General secretion pathway protein I n=1 Tax=uncultured Thiotrichaceae bacterium TaxID=298394 RepID=A0A6S6S681_9GAMM|nr:MAG: General secretion pathway protein I [uncultured Thiotrichaceae bacterium]